MDPRCNNFSRFCGGVKRDRSDSVRRKGRVVKHYSRSCLAVTISLTGWGAKHMRTFGVEEEFLLVDAGTLLPVPVAAAVIRNMSQPPDHASSVSAELQQEQIEAISPPQLTARGQLDTIRASRARVDAAARSVGARAVAIGTAPMLDRPHLVPSERFQEMAERFGRTAHTHLTNGFHVHVAVESREEGVAVLDRLRDWMHVLLALSANSPFWHGEHSGYASYRYQAWSRWPTSGPTEVFGSAAAYDAFRDELLDTGVPLDPGMLYFDARLCDRFPTLEVRVADVCAEAEQATTIAVLVRALVEACARDWRQGTPPSAVPASVLRLWAWQASRFGVSERLVDPRTGELVPARQAVEGLLGFVRSILDELDEWTDVHAVVTTILAGGGGAARQLRAWEDTGTLAAVTRLAMDATTSMPRRQTLPGVIDLSVVSGRGPVATTYC